MIITPKNFQECRGAYGDQYLHDHGYLRFVPCEVCGTEGRLYTATGNDPHPTDNGPCPECEGTGEMCVMTEAVTMDDLDQV